MSEILSLFSLKFIKKNSSEKVSRVKLALPQSHVFFLDSQYFRGFEPVIKSQNLSTSINSKLKPPVINTFSYLCAVSGLTLGQLKGCVLASLGIDDRDNWRRHRNDTSD